MCVSGGEDPCKPSSSGSTATCPHAGGGSSGGGSSGTERTPLTITHTTVATAPADRTRVKIGVGEEVNLQANNAVGEVNWTITGRSTLDANQGNAVKLTAADRAETFTVTARDSEGSSDNVEFTVIEPSGVKMVKAPGTNIWHTNGKPSVGIKLKIYIKPDTVSFEKIKVSEDDCVSTVTGYFEGTRLDGVRHAGHGAGTWVSVGPPVAGKGSMVNGTDKAQSGHCDFGTPYRHGTFDWPIPWLFKVGTGASKQFTTVHQEFTINSNGDMTVSKGGGNGAAALNDPTSAY